MWKLVLTVRNWAGISYFLFCFGFFGGSAARAQQWTAKNNGLFGGVITALAETNNILLAGTERAGIYRSTDQGANWMSSNTGLPVRMNITCLLVDGGNVYAGTATNGIYKSSSNGLSWTSLNPLPGYQQITSLAILDMNLFAGTQNGIYLSKDNGISWLSINNGLPPGFASNPFSWIQAIHVVGNSIFVGLYFNGVYVSNDNGANWSAASTGLANQSNILCFAMSGSTMYAGSSNAIYRSDNNGDFWTKTKFGIYENGWVNDITIDGDGVYIATSSGVFLSVDNGESWMSQSNGLPTTQGIKSMIFEGSNIFVGSMGHGVYLSTDKSANWKASNKGLTALTVNSLDVQDNFVFAATDIGVFRTSNHGESWVPSNPQFPADYAIILVKGDTILGSFISGLFFSTDHGTTWDRFPTTGLTAENCQPLLVHKGNIYGNSGGLFVFPAGGSSWQPANAGMEPSLNVFKAIVFNNEIVAGAGNGKLYHSTDLGNSWTHFGSELPTNYGIISMTSIDNKLIVAALTVEGLYVSDNNGATWNVTPAGIVNESLSSIESSHGYLFAGGYESPYFSIDQGISWIVTKEGLISEPSIESLKIVGTDLFAGTSEGVWIAPMASFGPAIDSFFPESGPVGTEVTISGKNFPSVPGLAKVAFNGVETTATGASFSNLIVKVPPSATKGSISATVNGFTAQSKEIFCVTPPKPSISSTDLTGEEITLTSSSPTGNQWFKDGGSITGATNQTYVTTEPGVYTLQITLNGCSSVLSDELALVLTGMAEEQADKFEVYPNPIADEVSISLSAFKNDDVTVRVFNVLGHQVFDFQTKGGKTVAFSIGSFQNGIYLLTATQGDKNLRRKIAKR